MKYTIKQAARDRHLGVLNGFKFVKGSVDGWFIQFESNIGMLGNPWLTDSRTSEPRKFASIDSAWKTVVKAGFIADRFGISILKSEKEKESKPT